MQHLQKIFLSLFLICSIENFFLFTCRSSIPKTAISFPAVVAAFPTADLTWAKEEGFIDLQRYGGIIDVHTFHQKSWETDSMRRYFGMPLDDGSFSDSIAVGSDQLLKPEDVLHDGQALNSKNRTLMQSLRFHPKQTVTGLQFSYFQQLCDISPYVAISFDLPILSVSNSLNLESTGICTDQKLPTKQDVDSDVLYRGKSVSFQEYLEGKVEQDGLFQQLPLKKMKISSGTIHSKGLSDLTIRFHGLFCYRPTRVFDLSIHCSVPFEAHEQGNFLFEPVRGNAGRWGFGAKAEYAAQFFWNNNTTNLHLVGSIRYDYILQGSACRAPGYKREDGNISPWHLYRLAGTLKEKKIEPLANIITQELKVRPQSRLRCTGLVGVQWYTWNISFGTDMYWQQKEEVALKQWNNARYNIVANDYEMQVPFDPSLHRHPVEGVSGGINRDDLVLDLATTEAFCLQSLYTYVSKMFVCQEQGSILFAAGGGCSIAHGNDEKNQIGERWFLWTRLGIIF